jgi:O-methyltransferase
MITDTEIITFVKPYTSVSNERILNVLQLVERVVRDNIPGDLAEVGVWKGGLIMAMALKCKQLGVVRTIHAYDTFEGMPPPTNRDIDLDGRPAISVFEIAKCDAPLSDVMSNFKKVDYPHIEVHIGDITKADPSFFPSFALLRLDTDWYESTRYTLHHMEPKVSPFGYVIIDDYGHWKGCRTAVDEFRPPALHTIDYTGVWWQKDYGRSKLDTSTEIGQVLQYHFHHFVGLYTAVGKTFHRGCGSYMIDGQTYSYMPQLSKKQQELFNVGKTSTRVLEVGVYLGHSLLILLLSNPTLRITCIDNDPAFSPGAVEYLNKHFGDRITFYLGTAEEVLAREDIGTFDCIHIDADHNEAAVERQFRLTQKFARPNAFYVFDDYEAVRSLIDSWTRSGPLVHINTPWCLWTNTITRLNSESS